MILASSIWKSLTWLNPAYFCSKRQILKTYMEIIPPYRISEIVESKDNKLRDMLSKYDSQDSQNAIIVIPDQQLHQLSRYVGKRVRYLPVETLVKVIEVSGRNESVEARRLYHRIVRNVIHKSQQYHLEDLVKFIYRLAKMNKKEYELMKAVEDVIIEEKIPIHYPFIYKILWSYTHLNMGTAVLYSHISKTLRVGQHELQPLQLAEAAYMLSKVSENAKGGYGIFSAAEEHVEANLPRMDFGELVKAAGYLLTQNIGTSDFQYRLQESLYNKYPPKDRLKVTELTHLLKATSGYYFKFKESALLYMLKTSTQRLAHYANTQNLEDIIWSWGRQAKGDAQLWQCLEVQSLRHLEQLKPRQLAFFYYSLCSSPHVKQSTLLKFQSHFLALPLLSIPQHYLVKVLLGMHRRKSYSQHAFDTIIEVLSDRMLAVNTQQLITFLKVINESDVDFDNKGIFERLQERLIAVAEKLVPKLYALKQTEIAEILYFYTKLQIKTTSFVEQCFVQCSNVMQIPKAAFIKVMFCLVIHDRYQKVGEMFPILQQLSKYGPIGYFFSPYEFPLLAYSVLQVEINVSGIKKLKSKVTTQIVKALNELNPLMLSPFVKKGYQSAMELSAKWESIKE